MATKIADLFAAVGLKLNPADLAKAESALKNFRGKQLTAFGKFEKLLTSKIATLGLGFAAVFETKKAFAFEDQLTRLEIASDGAFGSMSQMSDEFVRISNETAIAKEEIAAGAAAFVKLTGDGESAKQMLELFAKAAQATDSTMEDVGFVAATLSQQLGVTADEMEEVFSILIKGGKDGAVEFNEMARIMGRLGPAFNRFSGAEGAEGVATLNTLLQQTRQGFGSTSEAAVGLQRLMISIANKATKLDKAGISVFSGKVDAQGRKQLKELPGILKEIFSSKIGKDVDKFNKIFGQNIVSKQAFTQLQTLSQEFDKQRQAMKDATDVADDLGRVQKSAAFRAKKAWNEFKNSLIPVFEFIIQGLAKLAKHTTLIKIAVGLLAAAWLALKLKWVASAAVMALASGTILGPLGLVASAIALLVLNWDAVTDAVGEAFDAVSKFFGLEDSEVTKGIDEELRERRAKFRATLTRGLSAGTSPAGGVGTRARDGDFATSTAKKLDQTLTANITVAADANAPEVVQQVRRTVQDLLDFHFRNVQSAGAVGSR